MKRRYIIVSVALALIAFAVWRIWKPDSQRAAAQHAESKHDEHEHGGHEDHEGQAQVKLTDAQLQNANIRIEEAGPATIKTMVAVYGKVAANEEALARVVPRFPGIVKSVKKRLGDNVERGEVLAQIESNESLKVYDVTSEVAGTVIQKDITLGELVKDDKTIFTVANLETVWIDLSIFRQDFGSLAVGAPVEFHTGEGHVSGQQHIQAKVDYISPFGSEGSQTMLARSVVPNPKGELRPGLYVDGEVVTGQIEALIAVENAALQEIDGKTVVFVAEGNVFEAREVKLGVKDHQRTEVIEGVLPTEKYAAANSFILKAELGKGEAEHEH
jgi:cobalt-zinc-cadmium efflux system membrane fusion protein